MTTQLQFMDRQPVFERMGELANYANMTFEQQQSYMRSLDTWRTVMAADKFTFTKGHEKGFEKGHAEGLAKGLEEGRAEGLAEGRAEGLAEGRAEGLAEGLAEGRAEGLAEGLAEGEYQKASAIARNLKSMGMSVEQVAQATGLTEEEINAL